MDEKNDHTKETISNNDEPALRESSNEWKFKCAICEKTYVLHSAMCDYTTKAHGMA